MHRVDETLFGTRLLSQSRMYNPCFQDGCPGVRHLGAVPVRRSDGNLGEAQTDVVSTFPGQSGTSINKTHERGKYIRVFFAFGLNKIHF